MHTQPTLEPHAVAKLLRETGVLLELRGENTFKIRAYENAARFLEIYDKSFADLLESLSVGGIKGFGPQLSAQIRELGEKGSFELLEELRAEFPIALRSLLNIPGLGAKKLRVLHTTLQINSLQDLKAACEDHRVAATKGFGKKTEENLLKGIEQLSSYQSLFRITTAKSEAEKLLVYLKTLPETAQASIAGSLRRIKEIVKDIDLVSASESPEKVMQHFLAYDQITEVRSQGETKSSVILKSGIPVDLRVVSPSAYAAALLHFTGSKEHNTALRSRAKLRGWTLNEYGLFDNEVALPLNSEHEIYRALELDFIIPEMRENCGEVEEAAAAYATGEKLPRFVEMQDLKGVLHVHSTYSDGHSSVAELAEAVMQQGYQYLGITDHSRSAAYAGGLSIDKVAQQHVEIDVTNRKLAPFHTFKGIESDILQDGSLDYPSSVLETFDFIIASVHSSMKMPKEEMTARIAKAISNPFTTILGHISGRLLLQREGYEVDIPHLMQLAAKKNVIIEINANPLRLELDWRYLRKAGELGLLIAICPDAHKLSQLDYIELGVGIARKGGLNPEQIVNCWELQKIKEFFEAKKKAAKTLELPNV